MRRRSSRNPLALALSACLAALPACTASAPLPPQPPVTAQDTGEPSPPATGLALVVHKSTQKLTVFDDGVPIYEFPVVTGRRASGKKRFEGDMRTPEGVYHVVDKHPHARWRYFIEIDYPNTDDVAAYANAVADGQVPVINGEFVGIGGKVGIHGSDHYDDQARGRNWTMGCVAMRSDDVAVVYDIVRPGTTVWILP
jgi:murein L,D-transpeptidase YafK